MKTLKILGWYYLAGLTFLLEALMLGSIVLMPLVFYLIDNCWWFSDPLEAARHKAVKIKYR